MASFAGPKEKSWSKSENILFPCFKSKKKIECIPNINLSNADKTNLMFDTIKVSAVPFYPTKCESET